MGRCVFYRYTSSDLNYELPVLVHYAKKLPLKYKEIILDMLKIMIESPDPQQGRLIPVLSVGKYRAVLPLSFIFTVVDNAVNGVYALNDDALCELVEMLVDEYRRYYPHASLEEIALMILDDLIDTLVEAKPEIPVTLIKTPTCLENECDTELYVDGSGPHIHTEYY